jgi:hypothetical protein
VQDPDLIERCTKLLSLLDVPTAPAVQVLVGGKAVLLGGVTARVSQDEVVAEVDGVERPGHEVVDFPAALQLLTSSSTTDPRSRSKLTVDLTGIEHAYTCVLKQLVESGNRLPFPP